MLEPGTVEPIRQPSRRRFATWLGSIVGVFLANNWVVSLVRGRGGLPRAKPHHAVGLGYPTPRYIPADFRYYYTYRNRPDGFRGGDAEIAIFYRNPKLRDGHSQPLMIFIAPQASVELALVEGREAKVLPLVLNDGRSVTAHYHDGCWQVDPQGPVVRNGRRWSWNTQRMHSVVFPVEGYVVGIRAGRRSGISLEQLLIVAASF